jgi:anaerobic magnesium-protoporphyrin IX monomethyl ester cyclase
MDIQEGIQSNKIVNNDTLDALIIANFGAGIEESIKKSAIKDVEIFKQIFGCRGVYFRENFYTQMELFNMARFEALGLKEVKFESDDYWSNWKLPSLAGIILVDYLKKNDFKVKLVNNMVGEQENLKNLLMSNPLVVVLSTTFVLKMRDLSKMVDMVRGYNKNVPIIVGGKFIHNQKEIYGIKKAMEELRDIDAQYFIFSNQGEDSLAKLIKNLYANSTLDDIPNLGYFDKEGNMIYNDIENSELNINENVIDFNNSLKDYIHDSVIMRTSNGCPFKCAFCTYPATAGKYILIDIQNIRKQLHQLHNLGVKNIYFIDDTFNVPMNRFESILDMMIEEKFEFNWYSFLRAQYVNEEIVEKMKKSGCKGVFLGIESADNQILQNMNKNAKIEDYIKGINLLNKYGIFSVGAFIIGFPGETEESVQNTMKFLETSGITFYFSQEFYYLHNAPIHQKKDKWNLKGEGLMWEHSTMNSNRAFEHKVNIMSTIKNSIHIDPDMNLWQIGHLLSKGISLGDIKKIHRIANEMMIIDLKEGINNENAIIKKDLLFNQLKDILGKYPTKEF